MNDEHDEQAVPATVDAGGAHDAHHQGPFKPHESPWVMTVPLVVLAILSTVGGLVGVPYALSSLVGLKDVNAFEHVLEPVVRNPREAARATGGAAEGTRGSGVESAPHAVGDTPRSVGEGAVNEPGGERTHSAAEVGQEVTFTLISLMIAVAGILMGWFAFRSRPVRQMPRLLENKYYVDEVYDAALINPIKAGSREGLWKIIDVGVVDGIVNGLGRSVRELGRVVRYLQVGFVRSYAAIILLGALAVIGYFTLRIFFR